MTAPASPDRPDVAPTPATPLLRLAGLSVAFPDAHGVLQPALTDVAFQLERGEVLGLVGESGCGKSVTARALLGLLPTPPARVTLGRLELAGHSLVGLSEREWTAVRGREIGLVFQDPASALDPLMRVGDQIAEGMRRHLGLGRSAARERSVALLASVGVPDPRSRARAYPHQLSGGLRQRAMLAAALACDPALLIADEPTTALDMTLQAQLLRLLDAQRRARGLGVVLISHDLGVVAELADRVVVLYAGEVVEEAAVGPLFETPAHPYTIGLLASLPAPLGRAGAPGTPRTRLPALAGTVPEAGHWPAGCRFAPRCPRVQARCLAAPVPLTAPAPGRKVRCLRAGEP